jgi:hypothetical protein
MARESKEYELADGVQGKVHVEPNAAGFRKMPKTRITAISNAKLIKALTYGVFTVPELVEEVGLSRATTREYLLALFKEKLIHVHEWSQDARGAWVMPIYKFGEGRNKPQPKPKSKYEMMKAWRAKKRAMKNPLLGLGK